MEPTLWFIIISMFFLTDQTIDGTDYKAGDLLPASGFIGASDTEADCDIAGEGLAKMFIHEETGFMAAYSCVELPASFNDHLKFETISEFERKIEQDIQKNK